MLKIIQVGHNDASDRYIRNKIKAVEEAGMKAEVVNLDEDCTTPDVIRAITDQVVDIRTKAIIVQLPLPKHIDTDFVCMSIPRWLDIDGLHPHSDYRPLTPCAIMRWLMEQKIDLYGKNVAILGRSELVGKPLANMMIEAGATVTVMNSKTQEWMRRTTCQNADIIVSAVGKVDAVDLQHIYFSRPNVIVIDVGINRDVNGKLCGDVSKDARRYLGENGGVVTPVPGGVGRWTVKELVLRLKEMEAMEL